MMSRIAALIAVGITLENLFRCMKTRSMIWNVKKGSGRKCRKKWLAKECRGQQSLG